MKTVLKASWIFGVMIAMMQPSYAAVVTINSLDYELDQFIGATVTTTVDGSAIFGSTFDNPNGIDQFTLGELAFDQFNMDPGDRITLGLQQELSPPNMSVDSLTLTYGTPVLIGPGMSSLFVILEQASSKLTSDTEATSFRISFNGNSFQNAFASAFSTTMGVTGAGGDPQNQIVFDLTSAFFGFMIGDTISTVTIQNLGIGGDADDPDFLFAARAGTTPVSEVPEPTSLAVFIIGILGVGAQASSPSDRGVLTHSPRHLIYPVSLRGKYPGSDDRLPDVRPLTKSCQVPRQCLARYGPVKTDKIDKFVDVGLDISMMFDSIGALLVPPPGEGSQF